MRIGWIETLKIEFVIYIVVMTKLDIDKRKDCSFRQTVIFFI